MEQVFLPVLTKESGVPLCKIRPQKLKAQRQNSKTPSFREVCYIDGQWVQAASGQTQNVDNPATGRIIGTVPKLSGAETRQAIEAANRAFPAWSKRTAKERAAVLRRWFDLMMENHDDLARLMTLEQASLSANQKVKLPTPPPSSNGSAKKPSASMATPFLSIKPTNASWSSSSPLESSRASRRGIFLWP